MSNTPSTVSALIKVLKVEQVRERELIASNELLVRNHIELYKQHLAEVRFNGIRWTDGIYDTITLSQTITFLLTIPFKLYHDS